MEYSVDWDSLPCMEGKVDPRPLKAVTLYKMEKGGLRRVTTADNFREMDSYIRDYAATGHSRPKVCVLAAHWKVEEDFRGPGVLAVALRVDRKMEKETGICEKALLQDIYQQCPFICMENNHAASRDNRHVNALAASLYCLDGLRDPFLKGLAKRWDGSLDQFVQRYVNGEKAKTLDGVKEIRRIRSQKQERRTDRSQREGNRPKR